MKEEAVMELTFQNLLYDNDCLGKSKGDSTESEKTSYPGSVELNKELEDRNNYEIRYRSNGEYSFGKVPVEIEYVIAITKKEKGFEAYIVERSDISKESGSWYLGPERSKLNCIKGSDTGELNANIIKAINEMEGSK